MTPLRTIVARHALRGIVAGLSVAALLLTGCERSQPPPQPVPPVAKPETPATVLPVRPLGVRTGTFIDREQETDLRVTTYNIEWNSIFPDVNESRAAKFARIIPVLNPDILALQEIGTNPGDRDKPGSRKRTADDVLDLMSQIAPLPHGGTWHVFQGGDNVIVSKFPLKMTATRTDPPGQRDLAMALVDLPDASFKFDVYILANHFKCCDAEKNDPLRQQQADAIVNWLRDARTPGGSIDLPTGTAIVALGDLNIVGAFQPVQTLLDGDIIDEQKYGADFKPDWDDTSLADAHPLRNMAGPEDYTWRDDTSKYAPGRLDYIIFTDSVLDPVKKFVLDTTAMSPEDLAAAGLEKLDTAKDDEGKRCDHLPVVVDFRVPAGAPAE